MVVDRLGNRRTHVVDRSSGSSKKPSLSSLLACLFVLAFSLFLIGLAFQFIAIHRIHHNEDNINNNKISQLAVDKKKKKPIIAYLVTITGCGEKRTGPELAANLITQGAAVLKHSIHLAHNNNSSNSSSKYDYQMYAIIHPTAKSCAITPMKKLGYKVLLRNTPFDKSDISTKFLRENIDGASCCGAKEFLKLYAYTLDSDRHPLAVVLDLDSLVLRSMDDLFDVLISGGKKELVDRLPLHINNVGNTSSSSGQQQQQRETLYDRQIDALYTKDYNMINPGGEKYAGIQGGFLILRPDEEVFQEYIDLVLEGNYIEGRGWGGKYGYFYGGAQVQGICSYYFGEIHPEMGVELNRCRVNAMADSPRFGMNEKKWAGKCRDGREDCEDCRKTELRDIYSAHFTLCGKPWDCRMHSTPLCRQLHGEWFRIRKSFEESRIGGDNEELSLLPELEGSFRPEIYHGYCRKGSGQGYLPIKI